MVYYPYFRGKNFELFAIRESAEVITSSSFVPIIEPVRENLIGLQKCLDSLKETQVIAVVNPYHGDFRSDQKPLRQFLEEKYFGKSSIRPGILLTNGTSTSQAQELISSYTDHNPVLIHCGFAEPQDLSQKIQSLSSPIQHIFIEKEPKLLYRRNFPRPPRILINDNFIRRNNADYPEKEAFSDLHITFPEQGMDGYGDFVTVGDNYSEGGGPAYAVAIHLTFIDPEKDNEMFIYHFVSDDNKTPVDPAGKFSQALSKLIHKLDSNNSYLLETSAIKEFRSLHKHGHFPGLGYLKKLSIKHHLETLSNFHEGDQSVR